MGKIIFITGTDTGVGKTLLTAALLHHLRRSGVHALAMKPFCCGVREDVALLQALQNQELPEERMNPFYFREALAPLVAARKHKRRVAFREVMASVRRVESKCDCLIVEGAGGLLAPLGDRYSALNLIDKLGCDVVVVSRNRLGTLNHVLLTIAPLRVLGQKRLKVMLMDQPWADSSAGTNRLILGDLLAPIPVFCLPFLGKNASCAEAIKKNYKKMKKVLAQVSG